MHITGYQYMHGMGISTSVHKFVLFSVFLHINIIKNNFLKIFFIFEILVVT